jgi:hypothetical protein
MNLKALMVIPIKEVRDFVIDILETYCKANNVDLEIDKEESLQEALERCRRGSLYHLIVSHIHIFERRNTLLIEAQKCGLTLFKTLAEEKINIPGILLTPEVDEDQLALPNSFPHISLIRIGAQWAKQIEVVAARAFEIHAEAGAHPQKKVQIDFSIYPNSDTWTMVFRGEGTICNPAPMLLKVNLAKIKQTSKKDDMIDRYRKNYPDWKDFLNDIGEVLVREILDKNPEVLEYYAKLSGEVGGCENFRIRFITDDETYPLNLEAILVPCGEKSDDFWMLKAPVVRRLNVGDAQQYPLFENPRQKELPSKINCLIIKADVHGLVKESQAELKQLLNISKEVEALTTFLEEMKKKEIIYDYDVVPKDDTEECTKEAVEAVLKNGTQWHLVHYAGHSHYSADEKGDVFFSKDARPDPVDIQYFAQWLRQAKTQFVYLSSCESSKLRFVRELVKKAVPAVIGYRWDIDDDKAAKHAAIFYAHLFKEKSLEYAFLKTRQQVSQDCPEHIIWAAPVLVMQALHN